ncbi:MAG: hypothetical protein EZS28_051612, partial [Streblomastix strix]
MPEKDDEEEEYEEEFEDLPEEIDFNKDEQQNRDIEEQNVEDVEEKIPLKIEKGTIEITVVQLSNIAEVDNHGISNPFVVLKYCEQEFKTQGLKQKEKEREKEREIQ